MSVVSKSGGGGSSNQSAVNIVFGSVATTTIKTFVAGQRITEVHIFVDVAFDGVGAQVACGYAGLPNLMAGSESLLSEVGEYVVYPNYVTVGGEIVQAFYTAASSSAGQLRLAVKYEKAS